MTAPPDVQPLRGQLALPLPPGRMSVDAPPTRSAANRAAFQLLAAPGAWPNGTACLVGPTGSGKSFLIDALLPRALRLDALEAVARVALRGPLPADSVAVVEDVDRRLVEGDQTGAPAPAADTLGLPASASAREALEIGLFHLANRAVASGAAVLLTARTGPSRWPVAMPDLVSRLAAAAVTWIDPPDDPLLEAILARRLAERGLVVSDLTIPYMMRRMERSFAAAEAMAEALDRASLARGRRVTPALAAEALDAAR